MGDDEIRTERGKIKMSLSDKKRTKHYSDKQGKTIAEKGHFAFTLVALIILILYSVSLLFVLVWALMNTFKLNTELITNYFGFPKNIKSVGFLNYKKAFITNTIPVLTKSGIENVNILRMFGNSIVYSVGCTFFTLLTQTLTSYCVAKYDFKLGKVIYVVVIVTMLMPVIGSLPSEMEIMNKLSFNNNFLGVFIKSCTFGGQNFLILYATFKSISWTYAEAAQLDGANNFTIFIKIMLPLALASMVAVGILLFIMYWNEYYVPMLYLRSYPTAAYGLYMMQDRAYEPERLAASLIVCIPTLILFLIFRNKIMGNLAIGGIKG